MCAEITSNKFVSRGERQCVPPRHEGSIVQLGNVTASSRPKFDSAARRLEHGALSFCGGGGERAERVRRFKLAERENRDKSVLSERRKFLTDDSQAPASCLHPPQHIRRANQYAVWTVCGKCGARQTYTSKRTASATSKSRARAAPITPAVVLTMMQQSTTRGLDYMTLSEAQDMARQHLQDLQVDNSENEGWSPVTAESEENLNSENPNAGDLP